MKAKWYLPLTHFYLFFLVGGDSDVNVVKVVNVFVCMNMSIS
jgi:hypothetical protein